MAVPIIASFTQASSDGTTTTNNLNITAPTGLSAGDMLLIFCGNDQATATPAQWDNSSLKPAGFTLIKQITTATADAGVAAFYKYSDGTESGTTITCPAATANDMWASCLHITGVRGIDPVGVLGSNYDVATGLSHPVPGITTLDVNRLVLVCGSGDGADTGPITVSGGNFSTGDNPRAGTGTASVAGLWGYAEQPTAGATGNATVSIASSDGFSGFMFSLEPVGIPTIVRETLKDSANANYANGTVVYAYNSDGSLFLTGAVGTITGISSSFPAALTAGEVAFTQPEGVFNTLFLVVEPSTDTDGLVTNIITPTQLT